MILWQLVMQTDDDWTPVACEDRRIKMRAATFSTTDVVPDQLRRIIRMEYMIGNRFNLQLIKICLVGLKNRRSEEFVSALMANAPDLANAGIGTPLRRWQEACKQICLLQRFAHHR